MYIKYRFTFVQEFEDSLDNIDWTYNHSVLKMAANLNSEALVTLGYSRLAQPCGEDA